MYLKKYDLSKVNDETFLNLFETITGKRPLTYSINKKDKSYIYIIDSDSDIELYITNTGCFSLYDQNLDKELEMEINQQKVGHILLETQWHDPKTEPPKVRDAVILKLSNGDIIHAKCIGIRFNKNTVYFEGASRHYDIDLVTGWLPAENVIP